jgi:DNA-binding IclR family transcriptional regulator
MGCVNSDGSITSSAKQMLSLLAQAMTAEEAALQSGQPLFKVRSSLREMVEAGLVKLETEKYSTTDIGHGLTAS